MSPVDLIAELTELHRQLVESSVISSELAGIDPTFRNSAQNLIHYLVLRCRDLRPLQEQLSRHGLSSLGRAEPHVLPTLQAVLRALHALAPPERHGELLSAPAAPAEWDAGPRLLKQHTDALLGPPPVGRSARIMVTVPSEAADDPDLVRDLLQLGMDCMRINCAHDGADAWLRMIENLRWAEKVVGRPCRVNMDLAGPKLRTGPLAPLPGVVKVRPHRDDCGRVIAPARVLLHEPSMLPAAVQGEICLPVSGHALRQLAAGDCLRFRDARGAVRLLRVAAVDARGCHAESRQTCYFVAGIELHVAGRRAAGQRLVVSTLPERQNSLLLCSGDSVLLTRSLAEGRPADAGIDGRVTAPARIGCTLPEVFDNLAPGHRVLFDDGRISGVVRAIDDEAALIEITRTRSGGVRLRPDKGINLPDTPLGISPLTAKDLADLPLICQHADMVSLSFVNSPRDVRALVDAIQQIGKGRPAIILKIETRRGFESLPALLLEAMCLPACGVMIARGDLAVECGFERLAELQEEILWTCEAAHVPVIWATQVLESLAKEGLPSRAEITDAAMGDRAECVMLNKGPHILRAVESLNDILQRMDAHQSKKRSMLRGLRLAHNFFEETGDESLNRLMVNDTQND